MLYLVTESSEGFSQWVVTCEKEDIDRGSFCSNLVEVLACERPESKERTVVDFLEKHIEGLLAIT